MLLAGDRGGFKGSTRSLAPRPGPTRGREISVDAEERGRLTASALFGNFRSLASTGLGSGNEISCD